MIRLAVNRDMPEADILDRAASAIEAGGIVAVPTDTLYGLAVDPFNAAAVARLCAAKGRDAGRALPLIACDLDQVTGALGPLPDLARRLAARYWPGPLTLLVTAPDTLAPEVSAGTGRVGVRVPAHAVARELCRRSGRLLTATSANLSGEPASADPSAVVDLPGLDMLLDAGGTPGGPPSTIADVTGATITLVRAGAIPWDEVQAWARA